MILTVREGLRTLVVLVERACGAPEVKALISATASTGRIRLTEYHCEATRITLEVPLTQLGDHLLGRARLTIL